MKTLSNEQEINNNKYTNIDENKQETNMNQISRRKLLENCEVPEAKDKKNLDIVVPEKPREWVNVVNQRY